MNVTEVLLVLFLAWQISSMPIPSWIASAFFSVDSNDYNDHSDFVENKFGYSITKWGLLIFTLEFVKVIAAMLLIQYLKPEVLVFGTLISMKYVLAVIVLLGHAFPIYGEFKASKSMGGFLAILMFLWTIPGVVALAIFIGFWAVRKKVSISSIIYTLGIAVIVTFILIDLSAGVIAFALSSLLMLSMLELKLVRYRA